MKITNAALSLCLSLSFLACGGSSSDTPNEAVESGGGKADGVGGCEDIEADFLECSEVSEAATCSTYVRDEYPDAGSCCLSDVQPYAMCSAYGLADSCDAVNEEYLGCNAATDTQTCNQIVRDGYPDAGSCCGRDFEDYELCAAYVSSETCDEISEDYQACNTNGGEADCEAYLREYYPSGVGCCDLEGYTDVCGAYSEVTTGSCEEIAADYQACNDNGGEADCEAYVQEFYPWGHNCCLLDGFDDVCGAYDNSRFCVDVEIEYIGCSQSGAPQEGCDAEITDQYPEVGGLCCVDVEDYAMCPLYE